MTQKTDQGMSFEPETSFIVRLSGIRDEAHFESLKARINEGLKRATRENAEYQEAQIRAYSEDLRSRIEQSQPAYA